MTFDHPFILFIFLLFIPVVIFDVFYRLRKSVLKLPVILERKFFYSVFLFRLFIILGIIALAGPRWGMGLTSPEFRRGLDVVFAIDVSRSMDITDAQTGVNKSRLNRGLEIAVQSVTAAYGARYAAAIGRSNGYLAVPLTWDNEAVLNFLESLDGFSLTGRSTNLEALVEAAIDAFQSTSPARKVIVLVSDGEAHSGVLTNALNKCARENIIVTTVALGSDEGHPVQTGTSQGQAISRRETAVMRTAAERTGGIFIDGSRDDASSILSAHLLSLAQEAGPGSRRNETKERRTLFIILAIICYAASKIVTRQIPGAGIANVLFIIFLPFFSSCSDGKLLLIEANYLNSRGRYDEAVIPYLKALEYKGSAPYAEYGLGLTFYSLDEGKAALKRFENSKKILDNFSTVEHRELRYRTNYNSGIVYFEEGEYHLAAAFFRDALRIDPRRIEAKRNLELSLLSIAGNESNENNSEPGNENEIRDVLFEFLREQEQQRWKSREWTAEETQSGPDY